MKAITITLAFTCLILTVLLCIPNRVTAESRTLKMKSELAELQRRGAVLDREIQELREKGSVAQSSAQGGVSVADPSKNTSDAQQKLSAPEIDRLKFAAARLSTSLRYGSIFKALSAKGIYTSDQLNTLEDLLTQKEIDVQNAKDLVSKKSLGEDQERVMINAIEKDAYAKIKQQLGDQAERAALEFESTEPAQKALQWLAGELTSSALPLSTQQSDVMMTALIDAFSETAGTKDPGSILENDWLKKASRTILTPQQQEALGVRIQEYKKIRRLPKKED